MLYSNECYLEEVNCQGFELIQDFIMSTGHFKYILNSVNHTKKLNVLIATDVTC